MIYGLVPIGGKGTRLGLTFSKEMLPQKGFLHFNPIANHLVSAMKEAGAEEIIFIHGFEFKKDVIDFFNKEFHKHFLQKTEGFSNVLKEIMINISLENSDKILFGMPDTVFRGNPFHEMVTHEGIACALFSTNDSSKVDRLYQNKQKFAVKQSKSWALQNRFWGLLKFDGINLLNMENAGQFSVHTEIGEILNLHDFTCINADDYLDLGTWDNYNDYLKNY
jgi:hypothetical protein